MRRTSAEAVLASSRVNASCGNGCSSSATGAILFNSLGFYPLHESHHRLIVLLYDHDAGVGLRGRTQLLRECLRGRGWNRMGERIRASKAAHLFDRTLCVLAGVIS